MFKFKNIDNFGVKLHEIKYCTRFWYIRYEITRLIAVLHLIDTPSMRRVTRNCFRDISFAKKESTVPIGSSYALPDEVTPNKCMSHNRYYMFLVQLLIIVILISILHIQS